jgi:hypothetical protein
MLAAVQLDALGWVPQAALVAGFVAWSGAFFGLAHLGLTKVRRQAAA